MIMYKWQMITRKVKVIDNKSNEFKKIKLKILMMEDLNSYNVNEHLIKGTKWQVIFSQCVQYYLVFLNWKYIITIIITGWEDWSEERSGHD